MGEGISIVPLVEARWCFLLLSIWFSFWLSSRLVVALPVTGPRLILRHRVEVHFHPQSVQEETHFVNLILKVRWANQEASKNCGLDNSLIIASYTRSMNSDRIGCLKTCENWIESADLYRVWVFERYMKDTDIFYIFIQGVCLPFGPMVMHLLKDTDIFSYDIQGVDVAVGPVAPVTRNQNTWRNLKSRWETVENQSCWMFWVKYPHDESRKHAKSSENQWRASSGWMFHRLKVVPKLSAVLASATGPQPPTAPPWITVDSGTKSLRILCLDMPLTQPN